VAASPPGAPLTPREYAEAREALEGIAAARQGSGALALAEARWALARVHWLQQAREACLECIDGGGIIESFTAALVRGGGRRVGWFD
jgi:hypothetical protein